MKRSLSLAVIGATVGALGLATSAQADIRVGANFRIGSDASPFRIDDQVALAVDPGNPQHVVEVNVNYLEQRCEATTSLDGGTTWSPLVTITRPDPGAGEQPFTDETCGTLQSLQFGSGQNVYLAITLRRAASFGEQARSVLVTRSVDGGLSWRPPVVALAGGPGSAGGVTQATGPGYSQPTLAVDRGDGAGGADRVYVGALETTGINNSAPPCPQTTPPTNCFSLATAVSANGGQTFSAGPNASPQGTDVTEISAPVVNADHSVTVAWRPFSVTAPLQVARSADRGQTWGAPVTATTVVNSGTPTTSHVTPGPSSSGTYPLMASGNGNLYLVYSQGSAGPTDPDGGYKGADHFISPDSRVYFQRSRDNGATWSRPKLISDPTQYPGSLTVQTRHPSVSVSPSGRINIVWHDRRHWYQEAGERNCTHSHQRCDDVRLGDTYYSYSTDRGDTFSRNIRVNDRSHNNETGLDQRPTAYWNYSPQAVTVGNDQVLIGWMDSREGNFDTDTEDIYLAKVDFNASGAVPQTLIDDQPDAASRAVALSKLGYPSGNEGALNGTSTRNGSRVVIVNEGDVPGALAGGVLGRANPAPVLLSPAGGLPAGVKAEVSRLSPGGAFVIGDGGRLSPQVVADLAAAGVDQSQIVRLSGSEDAGTAAAIAGQMDRRADAEKATGVPAFDAAVIANPASPDAAAVAGLAAARRLPILYVSADAIPGATSAALSSLNITKTLVIGGPQTVSAAVAAQLPGAKRLGGSDQYQTSQAVVAESKERGLPSNIAYVADGTKAMDAALLGGVVGRATGIMLLSQAPLRETAAGRAAGFGLTAIDRLVIAGPPAPAPPKPEPGPGPSPGPGPGPGTPPGPPPPGPPTGTGASPELSRVSLTRKSFRVGPKSTATAAQKRKAKRKRAPAGTTIRFTLSKAAKVSVAIAQRSNGRRSGSKCVRSTRKLRKRKKCVRVQTAGTLTRNSKQGASTLLFSGRIGSRSLKPGSYQATLKATDSARRSSKTITLRFTIVR